MNHISDDVLVSLSEYLKQNSGNSDSYLLFINDNYEMLVYLGEENKIEISEKIKKEADGILGVGATMFV
jgi:hypothetical protein